jgi:Ca-activated chloride channel family protein
VTGGRELERDIVATSLRFGVLCRFTAYVAVDPRVVAGGSPAHRVIQPVELPSGWTGMPMPVAGMSAAGMPVAGMPTPGGAPTPPRGPMAPMAMTMRVQAWQALAGPRLARTRRTTGPASSGEAAEPTAESSVVRLIVREVRALREAEGTPEPQRAELLDDLASRLDAQATWLGSGPLAAALRELATALRDDSLPLAERWSRALSQLDRLAAGASVQGPPPGSAAEAPPAGLVAQEPLAGPPAQIPPAGPPAEAPPPGSAAEEPPAGLTAQAPPAGPAADLPPQRREAGEQAPAPSLGEAGADRRRGAFWRRDAGK